MASSDYTSSGPTLTADAVRRSIEDLVGQIIDQCADFQQRCREHQQLQLQPSPPLRRSSASVPRRTPSRRPPSTPLLGASLEELADSFAQHCSTDAELHHHGDDEMEDGEVEAEREKRQSRARQPRPPPAAIHFVYSASASCTAGATSEERKSQGCEELDELKHEGSDEEVIGAPTPVTARSTRRTLSFPHPKLKAAHCSPHALMHLDPLILAAAFLYATGLAAVASQ